jgi:hypothetical protein
MIGHKLPNKTKSAIVAELKLFHQLNNPLLQPGQDVALGISEGATGQSAAWYLLIFQHFLTTEAMHIPSNVWTHAWSIKYR